MANAFENRVPFMDNDLVDFAMQCPVNVSSITAQVTRINENEPRSKKVFTSKKLMMVSRSCVT